MSSSLVAPSSRVAVWIEAARPRTLPAAVAPVMVGTALAWSDGCLHWRAATICLVFAVLIQIGANFANDYFDFVKGADRPDRVGPRRAVAAGLVSPETMRAAMTRVFLLAFLTGLALLPYGGWPLLIIGLASIGGGLAYTGGPYPLGYHGLGEIFVFLFFGVVAVCATYFVQVGAVSAEAMITSIGVGALATNILLVNNYRDIETDRRAGKRTLAVRLGRSFARRQFACAHALAILAAAGLAWRGVVSVTGFAGATVFFVLSARRQLGRLREDASPAELIALLGVTGAYLALYAAILTVLIVVGN